MSSSAMLAPVWSRHTAISQRLAFLSCEEFIKRVALSTAAATVVAMVLAPVSAADATTNLKSAIDAARSDSGCPALASDPVLTTIAERAARELDDYVRHDARNLPITGENPTLPTGVGGLLRVLREYGYGTNNARLLTGYGDSRVGGPGDDEAKAIKYTVIEGFAFEALNDCTSYTKYGLSTINDDHAAEGWPSTPPRTFSVAIVVLAGP